MDTNTISSDDLSRFMKENAISPRKWKGWKQAGLIPDPIQSKGLGRGRGLNYEYPANTIDRLKALINLTEKHKRSYDEIRWELLLNGNIDQWEPVKKILMACFPPNVDPYDRQALYGWMPEKQEYKINLRNFVVETFMNYFGRYNPFQFPPKNKVKNQYIKTNKDRIFFGLRYLFSPYIFGELYPYHNEDGSDQIFEKMFSPKTRDLHSKWTESAFTDFGKMFDALNNADNESILKVIPIMHRLNERTEQAMAKDKKAYRMVHMKIPGIPVSLIWIGRTFIFTMALLGGFDDIDITSDPITLSSS